MKFYEARFVVVGAGFFGSVIAERIATDLNQKVVVIENRPHIGGNSYSEIDRETGIEVHKYGSHIFHTSDPKVWKYITRFSDFNSYRHRVLTLYKQKVFSIPINLGTINSFYGLNLRPCEVKEFLEGEIRKEKISNPSNLEDKAISLIGRPLYEAFIKGYTIKQWETNPTCLPETIINRLPIRNNFDDSYFDDTWQGIPVEGYAAIFRKMLNHKNIDVYLNTDFFLIKDQIQNDCLVIFSGPLDRFFDYKFGCLNWRTLIFEKEVYPVSDYQGTSVLNYSEKEIPYTRSHEFKHFHPERDYMAINKTILFKEYSKVAQKGDLPYYPVNTIEDKKKLALYRAEAEKLPNVIFGGRLGFYQYLDMHHVIASALNVYYSKIKKRFTSVSDQISL